VTVPYTGELLQLSNLHGITLVLNNTHNTIEESVLSYFLPGFVYFLTVPYLTAFLTVCVVNSVQQINIVAYWACGLIVCFCHGEDSV